MSSEVNKGHIVLQGGSEFKGQMAIPDRRAIFLAGGKTAKIRIIPAAAAPDQNHDNAGLNGKLWFESLGAKDVSVLPLIDFSSAQDPLIVKELIDANLIFLLGGFPGHLADSLKNSHSAEAIQTAYERGAVISGSSAGAMVLCDQFYDPYVQNYVPGLNLVPNTLVIPHYNRSGRKWEEQLSKTPVNPVFILGIDEQTAVINDGPNGKWQVYGKGNATLIKNGPQSVITKLLNPRTSSF